MTFIDISPTFLELLKSTKEFLNSAFISAFLSALAGAAFGVLGAQKVAERASKRNELASGIKQLNSMFIFSVSILNQALSLKQQIIKPTTENYFRDKETAKSVLDRGEIGDKPQKLEITYQFITFPTLKLPIEALKNLAYSTPQVSGVELSLVVMIDQASEDLATTSNFRNSLIESNKGKTNGSKEFLQDYFGFRRDDGNADSRYHDSMVAISSYIDDLIFFSSELATDIQKKSEKLRNELIKLTNNVPERNRLDLSEVYERNLMPPRENYTNWLSGFKPDTSQSKAANKD